MQALSRATDNSLSAWTSFLEACRHEADTAAAAVEGAWNAAETQTAALSGRAAELFPVRIPVDFPGLSAHLLVAGDALVINPLGRWMAQPPAQLCTDAIHRFVGSAEALLRHLPERTSAGSALAAITSEERPQLPMLRRAESAYLLREAARGVLAQQYLQLLQLFDPVSREVVHTGVRLLGPWRIWSSAQSQALIGQPVDDAAIINKFRNWNDECTRSNTQTKQLIEQFCRRLRSWTTQVSRNLSKLPRPLPQSRARGLDRRLRELEDRWAGELQSVQSLLTRTTQSLELAREAATITGKCVENAIDENTQLKEELSAELTLLRASRPGQTIRSNKRVAALTPPEQHAQVWATRMTAAAFEKLPDVCEIPIRAFGRVLPSFLGRSNPRRVFNETLADLKPAAVEAFREVASIDAEIVNDLETVAEVRSFAGETAAAPDEQAVDVASEAYSNSLRLLEERERSSNVDLDALQARMLSVLVRLLAETQSITERGQFGVLAQWTATGSQHLASRFAGVTTRALRASSRSIVHQAKNRRDVVYRKIGLLTTGWETLPPVHVRSHLGHALQLRIQSTELPAIYKRLFRLEPLTDPRFLIGREEEMAALHSAHVRWLSGQQAIVLLLGARGSGKTSLLNCAEAEIFAGTPLFRLSFRERMRSWEQLESFFRENLGLTNGDLEPQLCSSRRIVVVEEFERSYLRVIGGFDTARRLLDLIEATTRSTMWILVMSRATMSLLDVALNLKHIVSVQINTGALKEEALRNAILQRHNLSGLRLRFEPPPPSDPRLTRLERFLGIQRDPADLFFDSLYRESQGIFRSAFELWQGSVQRVEGGTLVIKQPLRPDYGPLRSAIDLLDTFVVQAIAQHGSLTVEETAEVLDISAVRARCLLDRLHDMDVIELEEARPGWRIRPQAVGFVLEILRNRNFM